MKDGYLATLRREGAISYSTEDESRRDGLQCIALCAGEMDSPQSWLRFPRDYSSLLMPERYRRLEAFTYMERVRDRTDLLIRG